LSASALASTSEPLFNQIAMIYSQVIFCKLKTEKCQPLSVVNR
jgi:hypothetical protein